MEIEKGHGEVGKAEMPFIPFTQLLGSRAESYDTAKLGALAQAMAMNKDRLSDGPDAEENLYMPAGYTYFGQFIDHDLTLDTTSTLNPDDLKNPALPLNDPTNLRTPRFDLDCVYGTGPGDRPYMYAIADDAPNGVFGGASLLIEANDLARASNHRAIIGDKRNDENSIVNQIQQIFISFHNKVVAKLAAAAPTLRGNALFVRARDEVRWAYQRIIIDDYLPRIVDAEVLDNFVETRKYELYPNTSVRQNLPREFVAAAYRFGHSAVRTGYRLNGNPGPSNGLILPIFTNPPASADDSLVGFDPLPATHVLDNWGRFFPGEIPLPGERLVSNAGESADIDDSGQGGEGRVRLQYAYKLDPSITDPLANLPAKIASDNDVFPATLRPTPPQGPSLALLNLLRGNRFELQGGQVYAKQISVPPLDAKYLVVRQSFKAADGSKMFSFTPISKLTVNGSPIGDYFDNDTPLWFYVLAEAQMPVVDYWIEHDKADLTENQLLGRDATGKPITAAPGGAGVMQQLKDTRCTGTQLGQVGGRILAEVFYGLLESDPDSIFGPRRPIAWQPVWGPGRATMTRLLRYTDPARAPA